MFSYNYLSILTLIKKEIFRFEKENGEFLFYAISVRDNETIALNMSDLKRFIEQQKQIIIYYEDAVKPKQNEEQGKK